MGVGKTGTNLIHYQSKFIAERKSYLRRTNNVVDTYGYRISLFTMCA